LGKATTLKDLEKSIATLPGMLKEAQNGTHSPNIVKKFILSTLGGPSLEIMKCSKCNARFTVDKPEPTDGFACPFSNFIDHHAVVVDKDAAELLGEMFKETQLKQKEIKVGSIIPISKPDELKGKRQA
jgi:hypothetical protein